MDTNERERSNDESPRTSRRAFLATAAGAAGAAGALVGGSVSAGAALIAAPLATAKGHTTAREILYLDNVQMGLISGRSGGLPFVQVTQGVVGGDRVFKGGVATVRYEPLILEFGAGMPTSLLEWISDSMRLRAPRKSGYVAFVGLDGNEGGRLNFTNALISEVTLPALDGAGKESVSMSITLVPEFTQLFLSPPTPVKHPLPAIKQKSWAGSRFRMGMDGINMTGVSAVDAQTTTIKMTAGGTDKFAATAPTGIENGALVVTVREIDARPFLEWFNQLWGGKTPGDPALLRTATLDLLAQDLKGTLGTVTFREVGVAKIEPQRLESNTEAIRRVKVELYVGSTTIEPKSFA